MAVNVLIQPLVTVTLCWWPCRVQVDEHDVLATCRELKMKINT